MALEKFREIVANKHDYAKQWKARTGGKVFGYLCCYMPEEIVYAAGILPVRIIGGHEPQELTGPYIYSSMFCPFCRNCLAEGLKGHYDYLDGVTMGKSCYHMRHTFDSWRYHLPISFYYFISVPQRADNPAAQRFLAAELEEFKKALEEYVGKPISREALERAIEVYNTNRRLLSQLYELRKSDSPPVSGAETLEIVLSSMFMDKEEHNRLLAEALEELPKRPDPPKPGSRLMVVGGENDEAELLSLVEDLGAIFVTDDACMGTRYFGTEVLPQEDLVSAIATRLLAKPPCPLKDVFFERRRAGLLQQIKDYRVEGVLFIQQKFCDPHELDIPVLQRLCNENNIPNFFVELDTTLPRGQLRTRAEAFLEMLQLELV